MTPHPDILAALELVSIELHKAAVKKGFDASHDDTHTDKSLALAACFLLQNYYQPSRAGERAISRSIVLEKQCNPPRDSWPVAFAHRKFNDSTPLEQLVIAGQFVISEIARRVRAEREGR